jgi:hypothetical protein
MVCFGIENFGVDVEAAFSDNARDPPRTELSVHQRESACHKAARATGETAENRPRPVSNVDGQRTLAARLDNAA